MALASLLDMGRGSAYGGMGGGAACQTVNEIKGFGAHGQAGAVHVDSGLRWRDFALAGEMRGRQTVGKFPCSETP